MTTTEDLRARVAEDVDRRGELIRKREAVRAAQDAPRRIECPDDGEQNPALAGHVEEGAAQCGRPSPCNAGDCARCRARDSASATGTKLVRGDRQSDYGHPLPNHERIAAFWNVRLGAKLSAPIEPHEVAACMRLVKESRLMQTRGHADSLVDIAGYADVEAEIHKAQRLPDTP